MGALLKDKGKEFELVATDGHRLALIDFPKENAKATLPERPHPQEGARRDPEDGRRDRGGELEIRHSENHLLFTVGNRQLIARLLDVNFPDYEKILSKGNDKVAIVSARRPARRAIRRVALFSSERSRGVKLSFEKDLLTIASASQELGEGTETLDVALRRRAALDRVERPVPPRFLRRGRDGERPAGAEGREHAVPLPARGRHRGRVALPLRRHADAALNVRA